MLTHAQLSRDAMAPLHPHLACICRSLLYICTYTYTFPHASRVRHVPACSGSLMAASSCGAPGQGKGWSWGWARGRG